MMFQLIGRPIDFTAQYTAAHSPIFPSGGVDVVVYCVRADTGAIDTVVADTATTVGGEGLYAYRLVNPAIAGRYIAVFHTLDFTVDQATITDVWTVGIDWLQTVYARALLIGALSTTEPDPDSFAQFDVGLSAQTDVRFSQAIAIPGRDISGWTALTFTVKRSPDYDLDYDALLTIRITNPAAAGTDGILLHRGRPVDTADPLRLAGTVTVSATTPDTLLTVTISAAGMDIPPNPENQPYTYEIDVWRAATAGDKEQIGKAEFIVAQSVRRSVTIP